jgi:hypothetical protein
MPITATFDEEVGALYVRLEDGERARSIETRDGFVLDVDADTNVLGIEALVVPVKHGAIARLSIEYGFSDRAETVWAEVARVQPAISSAWPATQSGVLITHMISLPLRGIAVGNCASGPARTVEAHDFALAG